MAERDYILKVTDLKTEFKVGKKIVHAVNGVSFNVERNKRQRGDIYIAQIIDEEMKADDSRLR